MYNLEQIILNELINNKNSDIRYIVAKYGYDYGLYKLINDEEAMVRKAVAEQGYGLDKLINDEDPEVRETAIRQKYG